MRAKKMTFNLVCVSWAKLWHISVVILQCKNKNKEDIIMSNTKTTLLTSDQIFATLEVGGKVMASVNKTNFSSIEDVVRFISAMAGKFMGLARLNIRNKTQGWTMNMALANRQAQPRLAHGFAQSTQYRQASLFT